MSEEEYEAKVWKYLALICIIGGTLIYCSNRFEQAYSMGYAEAKAGYPHRYNTTTTAPTGEGE